MGPAALVEVDGPVLPPPARLCPDDGGPRRCSAPEGRARSATPRRVCTTSRRRPPPEAGRSSSRPTSATGSSPPGFSRPASESSWRSLPTRGSGDRIAQFMKRSGGPQLRVIDVGRDFLASLEMIRALRGGALLAVQGDRPIGGTGRLRPIPGSGSPVSRRTVHARGSQRRSADRHLLPAGRAHGVSILCQRAAAVELHCAPRVETTSCAPGSSSTSGRSNHW